MVAAVDYLIGDFIFFVEKQNILPNTSIFIFPDHLKMGDPSMFNGTGNRELFVLTNTKIDINKDSDKPIYQIDLPKLILRGAEVKHNMKFFTDYIPGNKDEFLERNIQAITEINTNGLLRLNSEPVVLSKISKYYSEYIQDTMRFIAHAGGSIDGHRYTNSLEALNENYQKGFRLFELYIIKTKDNY